MYYHSDNIIYKYAFLNAHNIKPQTEENQPLMTDPTSCCHAPFKVICKLKLLAYFVTNRSSTGLCYHFCSMFHSETRICHLPFQPHYCDYGNYELPTCKNALLGYGTFMIAELSKYLQLH